MIDLSFKLACLIFLFTLSCSVTLYAGDTKGNGGDLIICYNEAGAISSTHTLDYFDLTQNGKKILLGGKNSTYDEKITIALNRLERLSPRRATIYRQWVDTFSEEVHFIPGEVNLGEIDDEDWGGPLPDNCIQLQVANQNRRFLPPGKRYAISLKWWNQMSEEDRAGLILHELIYRELKSNTSRSVRAFNQLISTLEMERISLRNFITQMKEWNFLYLQLQGVLLSLQSPLHFDPIHKTIVLKGMAYPNLQNHWNSFTFSLHPKDVEFYSPEGAPKKLFRVISCLGQKLWISPVSKKVISEPLGRLQAAIGVPF